MAIGDDFTVAANGDIRWTAGGNHTVIAFHRWLQDLADDAVGVGNDILDITDDTPSDRSTDNIITLNAPYNIDDATAEHLYDGSITQDGGNTIYSGLVVVGSTPAGTNLQIVQNNALLTNYWGTGINTDPAANILLRIMVKTRTAGADIDGKRLRVQARELGDTYAEFSLTAGLGNSTAAIFTSGDLNNATAAGTIAGWTTIVNTEGYQLLDINGDTVGEPYYSQWDLGTQSVNDLYERTKWIQRRGTVETIHGMNGELFRGITHEIDYDTEATGPFVEDEILTFGNGATAALLALRDDGASGTMWVQLLTGVAPVDNDTISGGTSGATALVAVNVTARTVSPAFIGTSTGSALIGAYGIGLQPADTTASDQFFDLGNTLRVPPNNVTFTVGGLVAAEDRVLVTNDSAGGIDEAQFTLNGALTGGEGTITVNEAVPSDTPTPGTLRVFDGSTYALVNYTGTGANTFTGCTGTPAASNGANAFISYIDKVAGAVSEGFTVVFSSPRTLFVRVRDGGGTPIKTFETTGTLGSGGGSTTAIRTTDA